MGCASSAPFVPTNGSNGAVVSPDAPPYELKQAADEDLLKPPEPADNSIASKVMNSVSGLADSEPVHHIMENATQMKEDTLHKINDIGESVKDKVEDIVEEVENKIQSAFGRSNSVTSNGMKKAKEALNDMKDDTEENITKMKESLNDTVDDMDDEIDKDVDTMVEDLEESLPRVPTPAPVQRNTDSPLDKDGTQYCSISPDEILPDSNLKQFNEDCLTEINLIRKEIILNSNVMCDMLLLKCESMDMFMYPTLETLTEISEDGVSNGIKTPRGILVLDEDNNNNRSRIFENFSTITTPINSPSVISFQMNGEHEKSSRSSGKSQNKTIQENNENKGASYCTPDETKVSVMINQAESIKLMNTQDNMKLNNEHKINIEYKEQTQNDFSLDSDTLQENSMPGNDEMAIVKQILRSPSDAPSFFSSDSRKSPSISSALHEKLIINDNTDESSQQITINVCVINGQSNNCQLPENSPNSDDMQLLENNGINLNSVTSQQHMNGHESAEKIINGNDTQLRSASPSAPSLRPDSSGHSAQTNTPISPVVMKTISPATSSHPCSASAQTVTSPSLSVKHNEEDITCLRPATAQSNESVISKKFNKQNSEVGSQKSNKSWTSTGKSTNGEIINDKSIKSAPPSAKSSKSRSSDKSVNSPPSAEITRHSHSEHTEAEIDNNMMCYQNTVSNQLGDNESSEISIGEKTQSPIRIASSLIATPGSKNDSAISSPVSTPESCMQEIIIST